MCSFHCAVGESLQVGDDVRLHIREVERNQVWFTIEWKGRPTTTVEIISPRDEDVGGGSGTAF